MNDQTTVPGSNRPASLSSSLGSTPGGAGGSATENAGRASMSPEGYHDDPPSGAVRLTPLEDPRSSREHLGWQLRTTRVLADLLSVAVRDRLPRIAWTVGDAGASLAGHCYGRSSGDRRHQFEAWCAAVGATSRPERTDFSGITHLVAIVKRYDGLVDIVVLADLFPDEEEDQ